MLKAERTLIMSQRAASPVRDSSICYLLLVSPLTISRLSIQGAEDNPPPPKKTRIMLFSHSFALCKRFQTVSRSVLFFKRHSTAVLFVRPYFRSLDLSIISFELWKFSFTFGSFPGIHFLAVHFDLFSFQQLTVGPEEMQFAENFQSDKGSNQMNLKAKYIPEQIQFIRKRIWNSVRLKICGSVHVNFIHCSIVLRWA